MTHMKGRENILVQDGRVIDEVDAALVAHGLGSFIQHI
ncbi:MAG: hypothetical protein RI946_233, partial [Pseudomonadota bacterium]